MAGTDHSPNPKNQEDAEKAKFILDRMEKALNLAEESLRMSEDKFKKADLLLAKVEEVFNKILEFQAKADNEALRANQAKLMVEEHSSTVAKLKGNVEADAAAILSMKADFDNLSQKINNLYKSCEADAINIVSTRKNSEEIGKATIDISGKVLAVHSNIEEIKKSIEAIVQSIRQDTKDIGADVSSITSNKKIADDLLTSMQKTTSSTNEVHERAKTFQAGIESLEKEAKQKFESLGNLEKKAEEMNGKVQDYESHLVSLDFEFSAMLKKIEGLLPGATSAGLASSFCTQKSRFQKPQKIWMISFISCVSLLIIMPFIGRENPLMLSGQSWDAVWRHLVQRLPFVIPLVWLGIYSGRQYMLSLRMEEEYAFKEAISTAFEGYKREMAAIHEDLDGKETPINTLCNNVLALLSRRPGVTYEDKNQKDITPLTPAVDVFDKAVSAAKEFVQLANNSKK